MVNRTWREIRYWWCDLWINRNFREFIWW